MDSLPVFSTVKEVKDYLAGKPFGTTCILTGGPTALQNLRVQLKRYGFGCSVSQMENGHRQVVYTRATPHVQKSHSGYQRQHARSANPERTVWDGDTNTFANSAEGLEVGGVVRVVGNRKTIGRDVAAKGWTASVIKDGDHWIVTRRS